MQPVLQNKICIGPSYGKAVFRIHDIMVWIWIRIRGSMPLSNGFGSGSFTFRHWPSRRQKNNNIYIKDKKSKRSHKKQEESRFFLLYLLDDRLMIVGSGSGSGTIPLTNGSGSGRPKNMWIRIRIRNIVARSCLIRAGNFLIFLLVNVFDLNVMGIFSWSRRDEGGEHSCASLTVSMLFVVHQ